MKKLIGRLTSAVFALTLLPVLVVALHGQETPAPGRTPPKKTVSDVEPFIPTTVEPVIATPAAPRPLLPPKPGSEDGKPAGKRATRNEKDDLPVERPRAFAGKRPGLTKIEKAGSFAEPGEKGKDVPLVHQENRQSAVKVPDTWQDPPGSYILGHQYSTSEPIVEWWGGMVYTPGQMDILERHLQPGKDAKAVPAASILLYDQPLFAQWVKGKWRLRRAECQWVNLTVLRQRLEDGLPRGVFVMANYGHTKYPIDSCDATFVPLPEEIQSASWGGKQAQLLDPRARAVVTKHLETVFHILPEENGYDGRWEVDVEGGKRGKTTDSYKRIRDFDRGARPLLTPIAVSEDGSGETARPLGVVLNLDMVERYLKSERASVYPFWLFDGNDALWPPFDRRFAHAQSAWRGPLLDPDVVRTHYRVFAKLREVAAASGGKQPSFLPLAAPPADKVWRLLFTASDLRKLHLLQEKEPGAATPDGVWHRRYTLPTDLRQALNERLEKKEYPELTLHVLPGARTANALWLTVPPKDTASYFPRGEGPLHPYPLYLLRDKEHRVASLFAFSKRDASDDLSRHKDFLPTLLNPEKLEHHSDFLGEVVAQGPEPLEPIRFREDEGRWEGMFLQVRDRKVHLVVLREQKDKVQRVSVEIPDDLALALGRHANQDGVSIAEAGGSILVGFTSTAAGEAGFPVKSAEPGPLWLLRSGQSPLRPLAVVDVKGWDDEPLTNAVKLAQDVKLLSELVKSALPGRPFLILPPRKEQKDRYLYQAGQTAEQQGQLLHLDAVPVTNPVSLVRTPPEFKEVVLEHSAALAFRRVERPAGVVLAVLEEPARKAWLGREVPNRTLPLWVLASDAGGAPLLALRPDGKRPLDADHFAATLFNLEALASRPSRVELLRTVAARGSALVLSVRAVGKEWNWLLLDRRRAILYNARETNGSDRVRMEEIRCPEPLLKYLQDEKANPLAVRMERRSGPVGDLAVLWLEKGSGMSDPRRIFLSLLPAEGDQPYPLWAATVGGSDPTGPRPIFSRQRVGGSPVLSGREEVPKAYQPETLLEQPALTAELLATAARSGLWREAPAAVEGGGSILISGVDRPAKNRFLMVENATKPNVPATKWRKLTVGPEVRLEDFLARLGSSGSVQAEQFGKTLRELPDGHALWWAEPVTRNGGNGVGFAVGPAVAPKDGWTGDARVRVLFTAGNRWESRSNTAPAILEKARTDRTHLPEALRKKLADGAAPGADMEFLRELSATVLRYEWSPRQTMGWGADPKGLLEHDRAEDKP